MMQDHHVEYEGPGVPMASFYSGDFRLIRQGQSDREIGFLLSKPALDEFLEEEGLPRDAGLIERLVIAWAEHDIGAELAEGHMLHPIIQGAFRDFERYPGLVIRLRETAAAYLAVKDTPSPAESENEEELAHAGSH